jgi:hypothetical protein
LTEHRGIANAACPYVALSGLYHRFLFIHKFGLSLISTIGRILAVSGGAAAELSLPSHLLAGHPDSSADFQRYSAAGL